MMHCSAFVLLPSIMVDSLAQQYRQLPTGWRSRSVQEAGSIAGTETPECHLTEQQS